MDYRSIPKVELHCHLEACFRPATIREIGRELGIAIPDDSGRFHRDWLLTHPLDNLEVALTRSSTSRSCGPRPRRVRAAGRRRA